MEANGKVDGGVLGWAGGGGKWVWVTGRFKRK